MRLIDAERIPEISWDKFEEEAFRQTIDEQPTVDAIPVKWLQDRCRLYRDCGNDLRAHVIENEIELWRAKNRREE